jgi:hypothetical protein
MGVFPVLTSACLPTSGYVKTILLHGGAIIDEYEHFVKQTIRNHYEILSANGVLRLTVPVVHHARKMPVQKVQISYAEPWQRLHLNAIKSAYGRAPFFAYYFPELENLFLQSPVHLTEFNRQCQNWIFKCLNTQPEILFTEKYSRHENDLRHVSAKHSDYFLKISDKIRYAQVFSDRFPFTKNLSIMDLLFNCGNRSYVILMSDR